MRYAVLGMAVAVSCASVAIAPTPLHAMAVFRHSSTTLNWYASWTASPFLGSNFPPAIFAPSVDRISGQTVRQLVTISHGGSQFRVRFSNEFGTTPLHIGAASAGYEVAGHMVRVPLTFGGTDSIVAYAGAPVVSDPVSANLPDGANLEVSLYLPDPTPVSTIHLLGLQPSIISGPGNYVMSDALPDASPFTYDGKMGGQKFEARLFLSEVDVAGSEPVKTVVAFGDSITDGMGSTPDGNHRWPDELAQGSPRKD